MSSFLFLGPELGKKQDAVDSIRKNLSKSGPAEEYVFYAGETPAREVADTLQNISLFADSRIIILKNAEQVKKKEDIDILASCIKKMPDNTALIMLSDENKLAAGLENAVPPSNRQVFYEMFEREKKQWVQQFFRRQGFNIEEDAVEAVLELVVNNTAALKRECSALMCFLPKDRPVTAPAIEKHLSHNREESAFTLFSRLASGDLSKALESVSVMLAAKESAQGILAGLAWCFRKLLAYLSLLEEIGNGRPDNFAMKKIGLSSPKTKEDYAAAAGRYNAEGAHACLALTAKYDLLLRSGASLENILMDRYIISIFNAAAAT